MTIFQRFISNGKLTRAMLLTASLLATSTAWSADAPPVTPNPDNTMTRFQHFRERASELTMEAMSMLGIPYRYGGTSPETGMDCSGLIQHIFKEAWGKDLPRTAKEMSHVGVKVDRKDLQPGDLVFFNTLRRSFSHVGIYLGDHKFIHAPSTGSEVRIESMDIGYWKKRFNGSRRVSDPDPDQ
jgi:cell wall-associated NlpC family hydrolase